MGIDYLNTDHPEVCAAFFDDFGNKNFQIGERRTAAEGVTGTTVSYTHLDVYKRQAAAPPSPRSPCGP